MLCSWVLSKFCLLPRFIQLVLQHEKIEDPKIKIAVFCFFIWKLDLLYFINIKINVYILCLMNFF